MAKRYHHNNLEAELIDYGIKLLARDGYEGFSMRKLAAMCGVSQTAPYRHFKDKEELLRAISGRIAGEFSAALEQAAARHPTDARQRLIELNVQYVRFLTGHPDYFRFVFQTDHGRPIDLAQAGFPEDRQPLAIAAQHARDCLRPLYGDGWFLRFMALWSMMHGLTLMLVCGTIRHQGDPMDLARSIVESYL